METKEKVNFKIWTNRWPALNALPFWILLLLCVTIPLDVPVEVGPMTVHTNEFILLAMALLWIPVILRNPEDAGPRRSAVLIALPFILVLLLSACVATSVPAVIKQTIRWLEFFLVFWFARDALNDPKQLKILLGTMLGVATVVAMFGIIQTIAGPEAGINISNRHLYLFEGTVIRAYSTFGHSNQLAGYLILMIPFGFIFFIESSMALERSAWGLVTLVLLTALVLTYSRGAWLATVLVGGYLVYENIPKKLLFIIMLGISLLLVIFLLNQRDIRRQQNSIIKRIESFSQYKSDGGIRFRVLCNQIGWRMFMQRPVLGYGAGNYLEHLQEFIDPKSEPWKHISKHIHNLYLQIAVETGMLGLAAFMFFVGAVFWRLTRTYVRVYIVAGRPPALLMAFLGSGIAFLFHNLTDVLTVYARGIHFALIIGLAIKCQERLERKKSLRQPMNELQ